MEPKPSVVYSVSVGAGNYGRSLSFYDQVLAALGYQRITEQPGAVAYGRLYPEFWVKSAVGDQPASIASDRHICFVASSREAVQAFFEAAIAAGARAENPPSARPDFGDLYYSCFVRDPNGNKIEVPYWNFDRLHQLNQQYQARHRAQLPAKRQPASIYVLVLKLLLVTGIGGGMLVYAAQNSTKPSPVNAEKSGPTSKKRTASLFASQLSNPSLAAVRT